MSDSPPTDYRHAGPVGLGRVVVADQGQSQSTTGTGEAMCLPVTGIILLYPRPTKDGKDVLIRGCSG